MTATPNALSAQFGDIDIYVFDQLLRGRITPEMTVLDAGCGLTSYWVGRDRPPST